MTGLTAIAPNAVCPRCNGPATQPVSEIYCVADCTARNREPTQPGVAVTIGSLGWAPPMSVNWAPMVFAGNCPTTRPGELTGWPNYVSPGTPFNRCIHPVVYRSDITYSTGKLHYFCYDCGHQVATPPGH